MSDNYIRDRTGKIVGRTDGTLMRDGTGRIVAKLDADGYTRDRTGRIVGKGNLQLFQLGKDQPKK
jgi:hypothetical protein